MKKVFALSFVVSMFALASCGSNETVEVEVVIADSTEVDSVSVDSIAIDTVAVD